MVSSPSPSPSPSRRLDRPVLTGFLVTIGVLLAAGLAVAAASLSTVLVSIGIALFAALGLEPAVRWLTSRGLTRAWSVVIVIMALLAGVVALLLVIAPILVRQIQAFIDDIPAMIQAFTLSDAYAWIEAQFGDQVDDLVAQFQAFITKPGNIAAIGGGALKVGASIAAGTSSAIVILVLTLYFLVTLPAMKAGLVKLLPARQRPLANSLSTEIATSVGGYVQGMVTLASINAALTLVLFLSLGLPFPPLMAAAAFFITLIPLIGSVVFWIAGSLVALVVNPVGALIFAIVYAVYMQVEAYVITPRVMNKVVAVPGALVVIGAVAGGALMGLLGALLAVPVTASILIVIRRVLIPRQDAKV